MQEKATASHEMVTNIRMANREGGCWRNRSLTKCRCWSGSDYQGKLTAQSLRQQHLVLYNAAGTNVSAAYFTRGKEQIPFVVDHKL